MGLFSLFDDVVNKIESFEKTVDTITERLDTATEKVEKAAKLALKLRPEFQEAGKMLLFAQKKLGKSS